MNSYKKKYLFSSIFLFYFIVYAISPLSYPYTAKKTGGKFRSSDKTSCLSKDLDIFFWELICTKLVPKKAVPHSSSTTILLRKARAILPEDLSLKIIDSKDVSVAEGCLVPVSYPSSKLAMLFDGQSPLEEHRLLHSGPSPPSV